MAFKKPQLPTLCSRLTFEWKEKKVVFPCIKSPVTEICSALNSERLSPNTRKQHFDFSLPSLHAFKHKCSGTKYIPDLQQNQGE